MAMVPPSAPSHADQLRKLAEQIHSAVEASSNGETDNTNDIVRQCHTMQYRAESPEVFAARIRHQPLDLLALMIAVEGGMLHALAHRDDQETSAYKLAELTSRPKSHIVRTLRLLTAIGVCDEVGIRRYRANDKTLVLATKGQIGGLRVSSLPVCGITTKIEEYCSSLASASDGDAPPPSAYSYTFGKPMYEALRENPARRADFDDYMQGRKHEKNRKWFDVYPAMAQLATRNSGNDKRLDTSAMTIVDVGGSRGHDLESFVNAFDFKGRLVLQDLPETINPLLAEEGAEKRVFSAMPYDFFTPQPIKAATLYLLLACLHNWDDEASRKILQTLADAMDPQASRLLISAVLLPDFGADRRSAELDVQMWVLQQANHRTKRDMEDLVASAGLEVVKVWENGERESIIEVKVPLSRYEIHY